MSDLPNTSPPPAEAAREVKPADAGLLRFLADDIAHTFQCASQDDACICGAEHHTARLRALAAVIGKLDDLTTGQWPYLAALAKAQEFNGDGAQYFTSNHMRIVNRMSALLADLRSARGDR